MYPSTKIYFVSPPVVRMKDDIKAFLTSRGIAWEEVRVCWCCWRWCCWRAGAAGRVRGGAGREEGVRRGGAGAARLDTGARVDQTTCAR